MALSDEQRKAGAEAVLATLREEIGLEDKPLTYVTCYACPHVDTCQWVWDLYNTDGDCLALK